MCLFWSKVTCVNKEKKKRCFCGCWGLRGSHQLCDSFPTSRARVLHRGHRALTHPLQAQSALRPCHSHQGKVTHSPGFQFTDFEFVNRTRPTTHPPWSSVLLQLFHWDPQGRPALTAGNYPHPPLAGSRNPFLSPVACGQCYYSFSAFAIGSVREA